jgi:RNA polymerase sigma-70 factor, ECF subfamily
MSDQHSDSTRVGSLPVFAADRRRGGDAELEREVIALFDSHRSRLLAYVRTFGIAGHDAEEVVQEVFLSLFRHLQMGKPRTQLHGWMFRVAHNLALKQRMASQRWRNWVDPNQDSEDNFAEIHRDPSPNPEEYAVSAQRQRRLSSVVSALPEQDQWCLYLRAEGLRYREIAEVLGISLGSVSNSLSRSLERLLRADGGAA